MAFSNGLNRRFSLSFRECEFSQACLRCLWNQLFFDGMIIVLKNLNRDLELVKLGLHELLSASCKECLCKLHSVAFHDLFALFNVCIFAILNDFPELIGKDVGPLVELLLGLVVFAEVRVLVREFIKVLDELMQDLLLIIKTV